LAKSFGQLFAAAAAVAARANANCSHSPILFLQFGTIWVFVRQNANHVGLIFTG
jgi:hypothetical protein